MADTDNSEQARGKLLAFWWPKSVSEVDLVFPARGVELTPTRESLENAGIEVDPQWEDLASSMFNSSDTWDTLLMQPTETVDPELAMRHLQVVLGCFGTRHQDKLAGAGWLLSIWFEAAVWGTDHQYEAGVPEVAEALREHAKSATDGDS